MSRRLDEDELEKAALHYAITFLHDPNCLVADQATFIAGAAWERERVLQLYKYLSHKCDRCPYYVLDLGLLEDLTKGKQNEKT